ncbi:unnamed protein product [Linum tenue]|uniref:Uncharacterized protein n=1 Tax=Linum tenue TaxID=586396 RepID=A0AAV0K6M2_9ROSI|nr:unnamed protein product [Linum tenue]
MPNGIKLSPHNLIKRLEQPILHSQILHIHLIRLPHLLQTSIHDFNNRLLYPNHILTHRNPNIHHLRRIPLQLLRNVHLKSRPQVKLPYVERLHDPLRLREPGHHRMRPVGERANVHRPAHGFHNSDDERLGGGLGKRVRVQ